MGQTHIQSICVSLSLVAQHDALTFRQTFAKKNSTSLQVHYKHRLEKNVIKPDAEYSYTCILVSVPIANLKTQVSA
jgi:hypothetical protein